MRSQGARPSLAISSAVHPESVDREVAPEVPCVRSEGRSEIRVPKWALEARIWATPAPPAPLSARKLVSRATPWDLFALHVKISAVRTNVRRNPKYGGSSRAEDYIGI